MLDIAEDLLDRTVSSHDGMVGGNLRIISRSAGPPS